MLSYLLEYCVYVEERSKDVKEVGDRLRSKIMESFGYLYENLDKEVWRSLNKGMIYFYILENIILKIG